MPSHLAASSLCCLIPSSLRSFSLAALALARSSSCTRTWSSLPLPSFSLVNQRLQQHLAPPGRVLQLFLPEGRPRLHCLQLLHPHHHLRLLHGAWPCSMNCRRPGVLDDVSARPAPLASSNLTTLRNAHSQVLKATCLATAWALEVDLEESQLAGLVLCCFLALQPSGPPCRC